MALTVGAGHRVLLALLQLWACAPCSLQAPYLTDLLLLFCEAYDI